MPAGHARGAAAGRRGRHPGVLHAIRVADVAEGGLPWRYDGSGGIALASPEKETRRFGDAEYVLEEGIVCDYALVRAAVGDRHGNLVYDASARNFNPLCAAAGRITVAEVERLVEPGEIPPEQVHTPGVFVQRVVGPVGEDGKRIERRTTSTPRSAGGGS